MTFIHHQIGFIKIKWCYWCIFCNMFQVIFIQITPFNIIPTDYAVFVAGIYTVNNRKSMHLNAKCSMIYIDARYTFQYRNCKPHMGAMTISEQPDWTFRGTRLLNSINFNIEWINNYIHYKLWLLNDSKIKLLIYPQLRMCSRWSMGWVINLIPHFPMHIIIYPRWVKVDLC